MEADELVEKIFALMRARPGYNSNAYLFVFEALALAVSKKKMQTHVDCDDLVDGYIDTAVAQFGFLAPDVFKRWGILTARDIGHVVFNLISVDLLMARPEDKLEQFDPEYILAPELNKRFDIEFEKQSKYILCEPAQEE